jgi:NAD(P) transhydrogenase subunit alpha
MKLLTPAADGRLVLDHTDVVQRSITVVRDGELTWPPPPVNVSAAPTAPVSPAPGHAADAPEEVSASRRPAPPVRRAALHGVLGVALFVVAALSPPTLLGHLTVFALAIVVGFYVIGKVHHALHTPLMSVTNAISGIIVVGALLQIGHRGNPSITAVACVAILLASINVFGGFAVTRRMLGMFQRS